MKFNADGRFAPLDGQAGRGASGSRAMKAMRQFFILPWSLAIVLACAGSGIAVEKLIDLKVDGKPLREVIGMIAQQTSYEIAIDAKWGDHQVSGIYDQVTVDDFFKRTLRGENISIIHNDAERKIVVRLFGQKTPAKYLSVSVSPDGSLKEKHLSQSEEYARLKADPDFVDIGGATNAEKWEAHRAQAEVHAMEKTDPAFTDMSGASNEEKWREHAAQARQHELMKKDPAFVDMGGMKNEEVWQRHKTQAAVHEQMKTNPDFVDESGMRNADIRAMHKKQNELHQKLKQTGFDM